MRDPLAVRRSAWRILGLAALILGVFPAQATEDPLHELRLPAVLLETAPETASQPEDLANPYPVEPVEQLPYHGVRHGFVTTTTGGLVFRSWDMRLPGRMPLEISRIYDSKISDSLPPPPPGQEAEQRWDEDLGKNWIFAYSSYLVPFAVGPDYRMATPEGDVVRWIRQPNLITYLPQRASWTQTRGGQIVNGGLNQVPRLFSPDAGLVPPVPGGF